MTLLTTERLSLAPVTAADLPDLLALWADTEFTRYISGRAMTEEEVWMRLLRDIGHWQTLGYGNWTIREIATGDYVGSVGIFDYRRDMTPAFDAPEIGWGIAPRFQGKGIAHEALQAALNWTDQQMSAARTVCMISPENSPSIRLAERLAYAPYCQTDYKGSQVILYERQRRQ